MKRLFFILCSILFASIAHASDIVDAGATDVSIKFQLKDSAGAAVTGQTFSTIDAFYRRDGAAVVDLTPVTGGTLTAHLDNSLGEIGSGVYEYDFPDAAFASGVRSVVLCIKDSDGSDTDFIPSCRDVVLQAPINVTNGIIEANTVQVSGDATAANNVEAAFDGTGGGTLSLAKLHINSSDATAAVEIVNSVGLGMDIRSTGTNKRGVQIVGSGTGDAMLMQGGANGRGLYLLGQGSGDGLESTGGATGIGFDINGGSTSGVGFAVDAVSGNAVQVTSAGGNGHGLVTTGNGTGDGAVFVAGATGDGIRAVTTAGAEINGILLDAVTVGTIGTNVIAAGSIAAAAANKIADHVLRRNTSSVEASSDGDTQSFKSLYGAIANQAHRSEIADGSWTVYESDGTTELNSRDVTTNASAAPITALGN